MAEACRYEALLKSDVDIVAMSHLTMTQLSLMLNPKKLIPTSQGYPRDWRGLGELVGLQSDHLANCERLDDPLSGVLRYWISTAKLEGSATTVGVLLSCLEQLDRFDVIDDIYKMLEDDIKRCIITSQNKLDAYSVLCADDREKLIRGKPLKQFDAFVLYAEEDYKFVNEMLKILSDSNLQLCLYDNDFIENPSVLSTKLNAISKRCRHVILVLSPAFLDTFSTDSCLEVEQITRGKSGRKLIPIIYRSCKIPEELFFLTMLCKLDYNRSSKFYNFWDRLRDAISESGEISPPVRHTAPVQANPATQLSEGSKTAQVTPSMHEQATKISKPRKTGDLTEKFKQLTSVFRRS